MPGGRTWAVQLNTIILEIGCGVCGVLGASEVVGKSSPLCLRQMRNRVICFADFRQRNKSTNQNQLLFFYSISNNIILRIIRKINSQFNNLVDNFPVQEGGSYDPGARSDIRRILIILLGETGEFVEFWGKSPNNSVYLAPIGFADVVLSSILLLISYHTPILLLESWRTLHSSGH